MTRVLFFIHSLAGGGAERVMCHLLKHLDRSRFTPALVVMDKSGPYLSQVPEDVAIYDLSVQEENPLHFPRILLGLRRVVQQFRPDVICSMLWYANLAAVLASRGFPGVKTVISERISTSYEIENETVIKPLQQIKGLLIRSIYPRADHAVAVSEGIAAELVERFGVRPQRCSFIHNPVDLRFLEQQKAVPDDPWRQGRGIRLLAIGRLSHQKGFDLLIRAVGRLTGRLQLQLVILGEGGERASLEKLAREVGVSDRVTLAGFSGNPYLWMGKADIFVLPSRAEGFPNVLLEAMATGLPVIAADCKTGPHELLKGGEVSPLVPVEDVEGLAETIAAVAGDPEYARELGERGALRAQDFNISKKVGEYQALFEKLAGKDGSL
jgi:glycosyltransferase involved in cell wall biosynthesis